MSLPGKAFFVKSITAVCWLCIIYGDYRDKTLMPSDTFPSLLHLNLRRPLHQRLILAHPLFLWTLEDTATRCPAAMRTALALLLLVSLACHGMFLGEGINSAD